MPMTRMTSINVRPRRARTKTDMTLFSFSLGNQEVYQIQHSILVPWSCSASQPDHAAAWRTGNHIRYMRRTRHVKRPSRDGSDRGRRSGRYVAILDWWTIVSPGSGHHDAVLVALIWPGAQVLEACVDIGRAVVRPSRLGHAEQVDPIETRLFPLELDRDVDAR